MVLPPVQRRVTVRRSLPARRGTDVTPIRVPHGRLEVSGMPFYVRAGAVPAKRHIQFRRPDGGLYAEELFSTKGFESVYSLLYHLRPPTATLDVRPWDRPARRFVPNDPLRNRHFKTASALQPGDAIEGRVPVLGNADVRVSVADVDRPMPYFYRNAGGDELLFVHRGTGTLETPFGDIAYRAHDYLAIPCGTTYRHRSGAPTRESSASRCAATSRFPRSFVTRSASSKSTRRITNAISGRPRCARRSTRRANTPSAYRTASATRSTSCRTTRSTSSAGTGSAIRTRLTPTSTRR